MHREKKFLQDHTETPHRLRPLPPLDTMSSKDPVLKYVASVLLDTARSIPAGETPRGKAMWVPVIGGHIKAANGTAIASILPGGGGDYITLHVEDRVLELDIRTVAQDDQGTLFRLATSGFFHLDEATMRRLLQDDEGAAKAGLSKLNIQEFGGFDAFEVFSCNTSSVRYRWMNFATLIGQARFVLGPEGVQGVEHRLFQVTY